MDFYVLQVFRLVLKEDELVRYFFGMKKVTI